MAEVNRPLMAVSQTCDAINHVLFTSDAGYVYNLTDGGITRFERNINVYELDMWITSSDANGKPQGSGSNKDEVAYSTLGAIQEIMQQSGFTRQGN